MKKIAFELQNVIHSPDEIADVLADAVNDANIIGNVKGEKFYNVPCSFDIETTSFYRDADGKTYDYEQAQKLGKNAKLEKCSIMYVWQFGINGRIIVGRTWAQYTEMMHVISETLHLTAKRRLIVYVHNLSYEFQFLRERFTWSKVFSIDLRKPIYAITTGFLEYRCSYLLSGYSLAKLGEQLQRYPCAKMVGDLDYHLLRHSQTPLTEKELCYCVNDIKVVMCYIQEQIENCKGITHVPMTKTGFVRKYCRAKCLRTKRDKKTVPNWGYVNLMQELQINGQTEFDMLQRAFAGGFTHANAEYTDDIISNVASYDFTSSYPYVMVSEKFPMSRGVEINVKSERQFNFLLSKYCCIFDVEFTNIYASQTQDNPISVSKCVIKDHICENNGRVVAAARVALTITDVDFLILKKFYTWRGMRVGKMYCYKRGYLPSELITAVLGLYEKKTKLKGVAGKEVEYLQSKEMLNSCYGMCVTNPLRDEFTYNGQWDTKTLTAREKTDLLQKYNVSKNRFLFYPWGVFVTAYARRNLFTGIYACGDDYIYSDTDSVKVTNHERHAAYFKAYNDAVANKLRKACKYHGIDYSMCEPRTIKGITKPLGVWDFEGVYTRFKTLGAKRYMVEHENALTANGTSYNFSLTVSGVNKKAAIPYLYEKYGDVSIFDAFSNYLDLPPRATGKNIHTYIDYPIYGGITDYMGDVAPFEEMTGVHLEPTGYTLSLSVLYLNYLRGIKLKDD